MIRVVTAGTHARNRGEMAYPRPRRARFESLAAIWLPTVCTRGVGIWIHVPPREKTSASAPIRRCELTRFFYAPNEIR